MKQYFVKALKYFKYSFIIFTVLFWVVMIVDDWKFVEKYGAETIFENSSFWFLFYFAYSIFFTFCFWLISSITILVYHKIIKEKKV